MASHGPYLFGRELDLPESAVSVGVRGAETVLSEAPALETGTLLDRINVIECADLGAAIAALGADRPSTPYLLLTRIGPGAGSVEADRELVDAIEAWRRDAAARGLYVMGSSFGGIETLATQGLRDPRTLAADTPFNRVDDVTVAIEVVLAADRRQAIALTAAHPLAQAYTIEVRPFRGR